MYRRRPGWTFALILIPATLFAAVVDVVQSEPIDLLALSRDPPATTSDRPRIALALSGGGARGLAQIGVLRSLEDHGIAIDAICGVSMGAIIGGLYATGIGPDSLARLVRAIDWSDLLQNTPSRTSLLLSQKDPGADWFVSIPLQGFKPRWPTGATSGQRLYNFLSHLTQAATYRCDGDFDRLPIRFRAVATDLVTGERVVFANGELASALRGSVAFPLAVTPWRDGDRLYADGGLVDPVPVELAATISDCPVVAVNTASALASADQLADPYAVANQATTVMTAPQLARSLAQAGFVCEPDLGNRTSVDFGHVDSLIAWGAQAGDQLARRILEQFHSENEVASAAVNGSVGSPPDISATDPDSSTHAADHAESMLLRSIQIDGNSVFSDSALIEVIGLTVGQIVDPVAAAEGIRRVSQHYADHDYTLAAVTAATLDTNGVLSITIDEASLVGIDVSGNRSVRRWVILRSFPLRRGSPFNARRVQRGLADLHATGLFEQITASVTRTDAGPLLHLAVTEKSADALRLGLHHNLEYQTEGFIEWAKINLFGLGNELTAHAQYAPRREHYFLRVKSDRIFRTYLSGSIRAYHHRHEMRLYDDHERIGTFDTKRDGYELALAQNISRFAQMALILNTETIDLAVDSTHDRYQHARLALQARLDDLDDAQFPTRGRRLSTRLMWGDDFFNGDLIYRAFDASGEWVVSPTEQLTLIASAAIGTADRTLPLHERFTLGGRRSFMGLADDELIGDRLVAVSLSARYRFYPASCLTGRVDVGNAWAKDAGIEFWNELRAGIGGGLVFDTPLGPLMILEGLADGGDTKFYFSWGYDF